VYELACFDKGKQDVFIVNPFFSCLFFVSFSQYGWLGSMLRKIARLLYGKVLDTEDWCHRCRRGKLYLPPRRLRDVGGDRLEDFEETGQEFVRSFTSLCGLKSGDHVLEIGSGSGRIALPLCEYLSAEGSYAGVEIVAPSVRWCTSTITPRYPQFTFHHANLYNKRYNPDSTQFAKEYCFPFDDASFDLIYLTSVFTHLLPEDLEHYLEEIKRLIKPSGKVFMTYFLLNAEQEELARAGRNEINFLDWDDRCKIRDRDIPESAVAYQERYLFSVLAQVGLKCDRPVLYGSWSGREDGFSFQDIIIASCEND